MHRPTTGKIDLSSPVQMTDTASVASETGGKRTAKNFYSQYFKKAAEMSPNSRKKKVDANDIMRKKVSPVRRVEPPKTSYKLHVPG